MARGGVYTDVASDVPSGLTTATADDDVDADELAEESFEIDVSQTQLPSQRDLRGGGSRSDYRDEEEEEDEDEDEDVEEEGGGGIGSERPPRGGAVSDSSRGGGADVETPKKEKTAAERDEEVAVALKEGVEVGPTGGKRRLCLPRWCCWAVILLLVLFVVLLTVGLIKWRPQTEDVISQYCPSCVDFIPDGTGNVDPDPDPDADEAADGASSPSRPETEEYARILSVLSPYTDPSVLLDGSAPQGKAFLRLVDEQEDVHTSERGPPEVIQRYALLTVYYGTDGAGWTHDGGWRVGEITDDCDLFGVGCTDVEVEAIMPEPPDAADAGNATEAVGGEDEEEGAAYMRAVTHLQLAGNGLSGELHSIPELCLLSSHLTVLDMGNNPSLTGSIPPCWYDFVELRKIELDDCSITGRLPTFLLGLPSLQRLEMYRNEITGIIPEIVTRRRSRLTDLLLAENDLGGSVPVSVGELVRLERIDLSRNRLAGPLPTEMGGITALERVMLQSNAFTGDLPDEFANLINLQEMRVHDNNLEGVPPAMCDLFQNSAGGLSIYTADCVRVGCDCCTSCCDDDAC